MSEVHDTNSSKKKARLTYKRSENDGSPEVYSILEGSYKASIYANLCLLVPQSSSYKILDALKGAKDGLYEWKIDEDHTVGGEDLQKMSPAFAHPIRTIAEDQVIPSDKTESDLLDWLIHGEFSFCEKYLIMEYCDGKDDESGKAAYKIMEEKHFAIKEAAFKLLKICGSDMGDFISLTNVHVVDHGQFACKFKHQCDVTDVDDEVLEDFWQGVKDNDDMWAHERFS